MRQADVWADIPFIEKAEQADALADKFLLKIPHEFCYSRNFSPDFVDSLHYSGFIVMGTLNHITREELIAPKLHVVRSVLHPADVVIPQVTVQKSKNYWLGADAAFSTVLEKCVAIHGNGWLRKPLVDVFCALWEKRESAKARMTSFELYDADDRLVAGEVGFLCGGSYTSVTGFRTKSGTGSVQLCAMARYLESAGVQLWDLGMPLKYKIALGAFLVSRCDFLGRFRLARRLCSQPLTWQLNARALLERKPYPVERRSWTGGYSESRCPGVQKAEMKPVVSHSARRRASVHGGKQGYGCA